MGGRVATLRSEEEPRRSREVRTRVHSHVTGRGSGSHCLSKSPLSKTQRLKEQDRLSRKKEEKSRTRKAVGEVKSKKRFLFYTGCPAAASFLGDVEVSDQGTQATATLT